MNVQVFQALSLNPRKQDIKFKPVLFPIMKNRRLTLILSLLATLQIGTTLFGFGLWKCPVYSTFGIPCPGCGISSALSLLVQGKWESAIQTHAFSPILLAGFFLIMVVNLLPKKAHTKMLSRIYSLEQHIGFIQWLFTGMFIYWLLKISGLI